MTEDRVALLTLAWLVARPERTGAAQGAHRALEALGVEALRGGAGLARIERALERLASAGRVVRRGQGWKTTPEGERAGLGFLGLEKRPRGLSWRQVRDRHLPASRLRVPAAALAGADGLRAAILSRELGVGEAGRSSLDAVRDALAWQQLGVPPGKPFTQRAALGVLVGRKLGGERTWDVDEALAVLSARAVGARRADVEELRAAIVRRWFDGGPREQASPAPDFADEVIAAAEETATGRFGDDKVFIAHVWRTWRARGGELELEPFKTRLVEANRVRSVTLSRADLVEAMNPDDVRESEARHLGATFHFVRVTAPRRA